MFTNIEKAKEFQERQQNVLVSLGAYLSPIRNFIESSQRNINHIENMGNIRRLQSNVTSIEFIFLVKRFLNDFGYKPYFRDFESPYHHFTTLVADQTLPKRKRENKVFLDSLIHHYSIMSDGMSAVASIPLPPVDINIKANNPFQAYMFFSNLFRTISTNIYLIDPYIDSTLFDRYFSLIKKTVTIRIVSDSNNRRPNVQSNFKNIEGLFIAEYPNYRYVDFNALHDRFLITEVGCYQLGGSLKDAAKNADYSVVQLSDQRRTELINQYNLE